MKLYVIRRPSAWASLAELELAGAKSARIGNEEMPDRVRWIRSYVVNEADGRIGTFCIYEAEDGEAIREHARRVGMPGEEFYPVATTVIVRADPQAQAAAAQEKDNAAMPEVKPPTVSIAFKDLPAAGQIQAAAMYGIELTADDIIGQQAQEERDKADAKVTPVAPGGAQ